MPNSISVRKQALWVFLPTSFWAGLFLCRKYWYQAWCSVDPSPCVENAVTGFDHLVFQFHSVAADFASNLVQNGTAVVVFVIPWILLKGRLSAIRAVTYFMLLISVWNGAILEATRAIVQRPRPLVFHDPFGDGAQISQYTSFYSGHTSFVALATLGTFLWINREFDRRSLKVAAFASYLVLTSLTALLRVWGGRHFPTDTLGGAVAGTLIALAGFAVLYRAFPKPHEKAQIKLQS